MGRLTVTRDCHIDVLGAGWWSLCGTFAVQGFTGELVGGGLDSMVHREPSQSRPVSLLKGLGELGWIFSSAFRIAALVVLAASFAPAAAADETAPDVLANACGGCHGLNGVSPGSIPSLHGLDAGYIEKILLGFRSGDIQVTVMNRIAKGYTSAEIKVLARYFGALGR